jgi:hypothetical protein
MPTLSYSGRVQAATTADGQFTDESVAQMHDLLDSAITAYETGTVNLKTAVVHFDADPPVVEIEVGSRRADLANLQPVREQLAQAVVKIGMEDSVDDAAAKVRID